MPPDRRREPLHRPRLGAPAIRLALIASPDVPNGASTLDQRLEELASFRRRPVPGAHHHLGDASAAVEDVGLRELDIGAVAARLAVVRARRLPLGVAYHLEELGLTA